MLRHRSLLGLFCILALAGIATADTVMILSTVSGGGSDSGDGTYRLRGTLGQAAIGRLDGNAIDAQAGFWLEYIAATTDATTPPIYVWDFSRNHPNPFNPTTTLSYSIPEDARVRLTVYNLRGQRVRGLVDTDQPAGVYDVVWDGRDDRGTSLASGVYFAHLVSDRGTLTQKMTLSR